MRYIVDGQRIYPYQKERTLADESIDFVNIEFEFSSEWDGMQSLTAQFTQDGKTYNKLLKDGKCTLPSEIHDGSVVISVFGYRDAVRGTTVKFPERICESGFVSDGGTPIPPTPDLYAQLLAQIETIGAGGPPYIGENGNWFVWDVQSRTYRDSGVPVTGPRGEDGVSGVYVGSGEMPDGYNVQIDPNGSATDIIDLVIDALPKYSGEVESV